MLRELVKSKMGPPSEPATSKQTCNSSHPGVPVPAQDKHLYSPLTWNEYFDTVHNVNIPNTNDIFEVFVAGSSGPNILLIHGAGLSAHSWAHVAREMKAHARVVAVNLRGHGNTTTANDNNFSSEVLVQDVINVASIFFENSPMVLVGHSMGGAIATQVCSRNVLNIVGLVVIDVVEGTAMDALPSMKAIIRKRPTCFDTVEDAIHWSITSSTLKNIESARVSIPSQLVLERTSTGDKYIWRTDLMATAPFWAGWFEGLSEKFLSCQASKLLLLAGTDRLDTPLTIGQMQGKFQLSLLPKAGHAIQEDKMLPRNTAKLIQIQTPKEVSDIILRFVKRAFLVVSLNQKSKT